MILRTSIRANLKHVNLEQPCSAAEHAVAVQAERDSRRYIPVGSGRLKASGKVYGRVIVWDTPYASDMYFGHVHVDTKRGIAGFPTHDGWRSFKGVKKVKSNPARKYNYKTGGDQWFFRAKDEHLEQWLRIAERVINRG